VGFNPESSASRLRLVVRRRPPLFSFVIDAAFIAFGLFLLLGERWAMFAWYGAVFILLGTAMLGWHLYRRMIAPPTPADVAKKLVQSIKRSLSVPHDRRRVGPEALEPLHAEFFDRSQRAFEALAFRSVGDWQDMTALKQHSLHRVVRTMLSADGTIIASISEAAPAGKLARSSAMQKLRRQKLLMTSRFSDGLVVHTTNDPADLKAAIRARVFVNDAQAPAELLAAHRTNVQALQAESPARELVRTQSLEEIFRRLDEEYAKEAARREKEGWLTAEQYRRGVGRALSPAEEAIARALEKLQPVASRAARTTPPPIPTQPTHP
jgi:hypothetical protein